MKSDRLHARSVARVAAWASAAVLLIAAVIVLRAWYPQIPRTIRRGVAEGFLRAVLIAYAAAWLLAVPGTVLAVYGISRARRKRRKRPGLARFLAVCASVLFSLILLESSSAAIRAWSSRLPSLPTTFSKPSVPGTLRIVVIGGSSALGEPFRPWVSVGEIVAWKLREAPPGRDVEVETLAKLGASLEDMHKALETLETRPDALIVYSGHNEFVARFEEERDPDLGEEPAGRFLLPLYRASLRSPFCRLVYATISRNRLDEAPPLRNRHRLIDPPVCTRSESEEILADFERRLAAITAWSGRVGALPILVIPAGNDAGFEPSRSVLPPSASAADRRWVEAKFGEAESAPDRAMAIYESVSARFPDFAEAHFRIGRLLDRSGHLAEASERYAAARDHDGLPIRARSSFQRAYRNVAKTNESLLIDGPAVLRSASPAGLLDDHVIIDAHHPTLLGQVALADAILRGLYARHAFGLAGPPAPLDPAAVAERFGVDRTRWAEACERTSVHYRRTAGYRFDPAERLSKADRFESAARRIAAGEPLGAIRLPGIGVEVEAERKRDMVPIPSR